MAKKFELLQTQISSAVEGALEVITELKDELQEWLENLPESLQSGQKADELQEAIGQLEDAESQLDSLDLPDRLGDYEITYSHKVLGKSVYRSRRVRLAEAIEALSAVPTDLDGLFDPEPSEEDQDEMQEALDAIQEALTSLDSVEFPAMR